MISITTTPSIKSSTGKRGRKGFNERKELTLVFLEAPARRSGYGAAAVFFFVTFGGWSLRDFESVKSSTENKNPLYKSRGIFCKTAHETTAKKNETNFSRFYERDHKILASIAFHLDARPNSELSKKMKNERPRRAPTAKE